MTEALSGTVTSRCDCSGCPALACMTSEPRQAILDMRHGSLTHRVRSLVWVLIGTMAAVMPAPQWSCRDGGTPECQRVEWRLQRAATARSRVPSLRVPRFGTWRASCAHPDVEGARGDAKFGLGNPTTRTPKTEALHAEGLFTCDGGGGRI